MPALPDKSAESGPTESDPVWLDATAAGFEQRFQALLDRASAQDPEIAQTAARIIHEVQTQGDDALLALTQRFDHLPLAGPQDLRITHEECDRAIALCSAPDLAALDFAAQRIEAFHRLQRPQNHHFTDDTGTELGLVWSAVSSAGLYVPGGTAAYPSSVLMNAIPAKIAGVARLVMVVPTPHGQINPLVLAAAHRVGVGEIYRIGGAQAIAALAYGTQTIARVDKVVGPGNAYVAAAKRQLFGVIGIDSIAGPSEILVVADRDNDPDWIAADLLSQAEHDEAAQAILLTDDLSFAQAVAGCVQTQLGQLPRQTIARASWQNHGAIILVPDLAACAPLIDRIAPEHLELAIADPHGLAAKVRHAGAIFLGRHTPEAIGDYVAGPNHVLPTARTARFSSGLSVFDFLKRTTLVGCDAAALGKLGPAAMRLAAAEGLDGHARSIALRLASP